ncbi:MAG: class GN sortase [Pseudomonadota bacterium]
MRTNNTLYTMPLLCRYPMPSHGIRRQSRWARLPTRIRLMAATTIMLFMIGFASAADAAYLTLKAVLAQQLIERAWHQTLQSDGAPHRPWPWADTTPVARLIIESADIDTRVLAGSSGTTLAFGPGMASGSGVPGQNGVVVIGAHRDTHFKNLKSVSIGDTIRLQDQYLDWHEYRITSKSIADIRKEAIPVHQNAARLVLVTCYPFEALLPGGPLRYVLDAELI